MLTKAGVKLLDFGLAKLSGGAGRRASRSWRGNAVRAAADHRQGHDSRHAPVHGAGAARRQGRRSSRATSSRSARFSTRWPPGGARSTARARATLIARDPREGSAADGVGAAAHAAGARTHRPRVPREGSRRSVAERARRAVAASLDRRRGIAGRRRCPSCSAPPQPASRRGCCGGRLLRDCGGTCLRTTSPKRPQRQKCFASRFRRRPAPSSHPAGPVRSITSSSSLRTGLASRSSPVRLAPSGSFGCAESTRSRRRRCRGPTARGIRSGHPTAGSSPISCATAVSSASTRTADRPPLFAERLPAAGTAPGDRMTRLCLPAAHVRVCFGFPPVAGRRPQ